MAAIVERLRADVEPLSRRTVERYRTEIADYAASNGALIEGEVLSTTRRSLQSLLERLESGAQPTPEQLDEMRRAFARRVHQDVSLTSIQQACWIACESF